ncbi:MAG: hypothetical protein HYZ53_24515 [Planctomycetes bacterium]|nr:hypothetical protein [Planctomycetota bacterium]
MSRLVLSLARVAVGALALFSAGCLQVENKFVVYPDGSGRMVTTMKMDQNAMEMMKTMNPGGGQGGEGPENPMSGREMKGLTGGQKITIVTEGVFSDINKVEGQGVKFAFTKLKSGGNKLKMEVDLSKAGGPGMGGGMGMGLGGGDEKKEEKKDEKQGDKKGESLVDGDDGDDEEEGGSPGDMAQAFAGEMFKGMSFKYIVVMPGTVAKSNSKLVDGRTVTLALDGGALAQAKKTHTLSASCAAADDAVLAEHEAFKKELDAAGKAGGGLGSPKLGGDDKGGAKPEGGDEEK